MWRTPPCTRACKLCRSFTDAFVEAIYGSHHVHFLFSSLLMEDSHFDSYCSDGLVQPPQLVSFFPRSTGGTWRIRKSAKDFNFYTKNLIPPKVWAQKIWTSKSPNPQAIPQKAAKKRRGIVTDHFPPGEKKTNLPEVAFRYALLGGGFRYFLFSSPSGEDFQFD